MTEKGFVREKGFVKEGVKPVEGGVETVVVAKPVGRARVRREREGVSSLRKSKSEGTYDDGSLPSSKTSYDDGSFVIVVVIVSYDDGYKRTVVT